MLETDVQGKRGDALEIRTIQCVQGRNRGLYRKARENLQDRQIRDGEMHGLRLSYQKERVQSGARGYCPASNRAAKVRVEDIVDLIRRLFAEFVCFLFKQRLTLGGTKVIDRTVVVLIFVLDLARIYWHLADWILDEHLRGLRFEVFHRSVVLMLPLTRSISSHWY